MDKTLLPSIGILAGVMTLAYYIGGREEVKWADSHSAEEFDRSPISVPKDWEPKDYPYEKRVTAETKSKWCENCGELDDSDEDAWNHYQFILKQKNSTKPVMRFISGGACEGCGSDLCQNCIEGRTSGNFNPLFEPACDDCGYPFCKGCKDEDEDRCNDCQEEYEANVCDCCGHVHHAESLGAEDEDYCQNCGIGSDEWPHGIYEITIYNKWGDGGDYSFCGEGCEGQWMRENRMTYEAESETFESPASCNICGETFDSFLAFDGHFQTHFPSLRKHRKRAETISSIIPGYFIHTPDEKFGPYANIMEADTAAEKLMSEGVQVLGITKEGFEGVVSYEALEYNAESWPASARFCQTCGSDEPYYDYVKCDCGTVNCDACRCGDCGGCHQSAHCHYNTECASCGKHYRSQTCEYCESFSAEGIRETEYTAKGDYKKLKGVSAEGYYFTIVNSGQDSPYAILHDNRSWNKNKNDRKLPLKRESHDMWLARCESSGSLTRFPDNWCMDCASNLDSCNCDEDYYAESVAIDHENCGMGPSDCIECGEDACFDCDTYCDNCEQTIHKNCIEQHGDDCLEAESFGAEEAFKPDSNFVAIKKLEKNWTENHSDATWEEMLSVEISRLRNRLIRKGYDPNAKIGSSYYAESIPGDRELDRYIESRRKFHDHPNKASIISDNPKRKGESMTQWTRRLQKDAESFSAERKKKKSGCLHFKYGKHCWAYSGNGAICVDCGLTTYIDEDGNKSYGTRSVSFKGNYDAHQAESFSAEENGLGTRPLETNSWRDDCPACGEPSLMVIGRIQCENCNHVVHPHEWSISPMYRNAESFAADYLEPCYVFFGKNDDKPVYVDHPPAFHPSHDSTNKGLAREWVAIQIENERTWPSVKDAKEAFLRWLKKMKAPSTMVPAASVERRRTDKLIFNIPFAETTKVQIVEPHGDWLAESFRRPKLGSSYGRGDWEDPDCISCGLSPAKFPVNVNGVRFELIDGLCPNCTFRRNEYGH